MQTLRNIVKTDPEIIRSTIILNLSHKLSYPLFIIERCSSLVIETIHYFESKCSPTCVLFIDASKAFDRVRHIDLFNVLSKRNMCALVRRLLMTMYSDQRIQVRWSNALSEMFHMKNGVKQGAVLSQNFSLLS